MAAGINCIREVSQPAATDRSSSSSSWQRGTNENKNEPVAAVLPEGGTDLSVHGPEHVTPVAAEPNGRPRKALGWGFPAERLHKLLAA
ncbi:hypothetical protein [Streptomyces sp. CB03911]|uniref:hypothetical protein n=1 Tax=Streptomyces sp. CB03911 TaxID=1804758 RepID=UPI0018FE9E1D|nr:hypothetical protein [Streptomyces sp. CB03911]